MVPIQFFGDVHCSSAFEFVCAVVRALFAQFMFVKLTLLSVTAP
eukprot:SAG31_NODE_22167_length_532_cov_0.946882_1_plen_43_part_10